MVDGIFPRPCRSPGQRQEKHQQVPAHVREGKRPESPLRRNQRRLAAHWTVVSSVPFHTSHPLQECTGRGREDYQLSLWTVNPEFCDNVTIKGHYHPTMPSQYGRHQPLSLVRTYTSASCHISVGDDCITIKSDVTCKHVNWAFLCENITITNCTMLSGHGGVVIGSEMSGE